MRKVLVRGGSHAHYVPSGRGSPTRAEREGGHLVYAAAGTLRAVAFNLATLETRGTPVPVVPDVATTSLGALDAVVAGDGTLAYVSGAARSVARTLVWVDRRGREEPIKAPARAYVYPRLSPDGTRVAAEVRDQEWDIWIANLVSTTFTRFSFGPAADRLPLWTPDGRRIIWSSERAGTANLYWQAADGSGSVERLTQNPNSQFPSAISPDGTRLVVREQAQTRDLMVVAMDKAPPQTDPGRGQPPELRRTQPLIQTRAAETSAEISPDGRWIAYESDESGQDEIYVRPFPDVSAGPWQVSTGGGTKPLWARNGRELFYLVPSGGGAAVMSAPLERGASFTAGTPTKVLEGPYFFGTSGGGDTASFRTYDVSSDGQRFLMIKLPGGSEQTAAPPSLIVVQHWVEELKARVPLR
jgi:serine/threonine-protein kinase